MQPELLVKANLPFRLNKRGDIVGTHFLRAGAIAQIKALVAAMRPVGAFGHMDDQNLDVAGSFSTRMATGGSHAGGHIFYFRQGFVGRDHNRRFG